MVIPEYKIELLNKSKKIISTVEHIDKINLIFREISVDKKKRVKNTINLKLVEKEIKKKNLTKKERKFQNFCKKKKRV